MQTLTNKKNETLFIANTITIQGDASFEFLITILTVKIRILKYYF